MTDSAGQLSRKDERMQEIAERGATFIASALQPGEQVRIVVVAQTRPRGTHGLEMVVGAAMLLVIRWHLVVLTDRRLFLLDCGRAQGNSGSRFTPRSIAWSEPLDAIEVEAYREGQLYTKLCLHRRGDSDDTEAIRLKLPRPWRAVGRQLTEGLGENPAT
jgi:hypothetical protein